LYVLKSVIEDDGIYTEALDSEHASGIAILPDNHRQTGQVLGQEHRLIADDLGWQETSMPIRDNQYARPGSPPVPPTQHADTDAFHVQEPGNSLDDGGFSGTP
jgi:hypothetical protein